MPRLQELHVSVKQPPLSVGYPPPHDTEAKGRLGGLRCGPPGEAAEVVAARPTTQTRPTSRPFPGGLFCLLFLLQHVEVLRLPVVCDERSGALLRFKLEGFRERHADAFRLEQRPEFDLILQSRAGGITEAVA